MWSPKRNRDGSLSPYYEFMRELGPGDLVFSYADTWIRKIGIVQSNAYSCPKPEEFGSAGRAWDNLGWRVDIRFFDLKNPIRPMELMERLRPVLPSKYSPLKPNGYGNQIYLTEVPALMAEVLGALIGPQFEAIRGASIPAITDEEARMSPCVEEIKAWDEHLVKVVEGNTQIDSTQRQAIIQARVGQGLFRERVAKIETHCRVTKVDRPNHLIASHCKPWRECRDDERLDGENGLLLSPAIDHLFDRGFISFEDQGRLIISPSAHRLSLQRMGVPVDEPLNVGSFTQGQRNFLSYHRDNIFLQRRAG